jgi:predicted glycoside hydrolase/deacetylase ChbG (UPF0249 family)
MLNTPSAENAALLEALGYASTDRLLIIHADDAGLCHSVNQATIQAMTEGVVTSASLMVPCPAFSGMAEICREHPTLDFGIHLTLTAEWNHYRWKPVMPTGAVSSLLDFTGHFPRKEVEVQRRARLSELAEELEQQVATAEAQGVSLSHVDSHMFTLFHKPFFETYLQVAEAHNLSPMLPAVMPKSMEPSRRRGVLTPRILNNLRQRGFLILDRLYMLQNRPDTNTLEQRKAKYHDLLRNLPSGLSELIIHVSLDDEEIQQVARRWYLRWMDYQIFTDPQTRERIEELGIRLVSYKDLRPAWQKIVAERPASTSSRDTGLWGLLSGRWANR